MQGPCIHLPTSTTTPTLMADKSMVDEFKVEESMADKLYNSVTHGIYNYVMDLITCNSLIDSDFIYLKPILYDVISNSSRMMSLVFTVYVIVRCVI